MRKEARENVEPGMERLMSDKGKWTPEPWRVQQLLPDGVIVLKEAVEIVTDEWDVVTATPGVKPIRRTEDAARIVACVNALAGLNPEGVRELVEAAREAYGLLYRELPTDGVEPAEMRRLRAALAKLVKGGER